MHKPSEIRYDITGQVILPGHTCWLLIKGDTDIGVEIRYMNIGWHPSIIQAAQTFQDTVQRHPIY